MCVYIYIYMLTLGSTVRGLVMHECVVVRCRAQWLKGAAAPTSYLPYSTPL